MVERGSVWSPREGTRGCCVALEGEEKGDLKVVGMCRSLGNRYSPSLKCPWEWRSYWLPQGCGFFFSQDGDEKLGEREGSQFGSDCFSQSRKTKFLFRLQFPLGASHLRRFPLIYRLVGRAKRTVFSTVCLASLWERRAVHLPGFSAVSLLFCLSLKQSSVPVLLRGFGRVRGCSWECLFLTYCGTLTVTICLC